MEKIYLSILQFYKENIKPNLFIHLFFNFDSFGRGEAFGSGERFG
jgi:hypothetical protein